MAALFVCGCAASPDVQIEISRFPVSKVEVQSFRKGESTTGAPLDSFLAHPAPSEFTRISGQWSDSSATEYSKTGTYYGAEKDRFWFVEVYPAPTKMQMDAILTARDAYATDLAWTINASPRIMPRFERKHFVWGTAVTFLVQYQNDNTDFVPNNGMLCYEAHGISNNGEYIRARFGVTHPRLTEFGPGVRDYREGGAANPTSRIRRDRDYRMVEVAPPKGFEPSLGEIDAFLDTIDIIKR